MLMFKYQGLVSDCRTAITTGTIAVHAIVIHAIVIHAIVIHVIATNVIAIRSCLHCNKIFF